MFSPKNMTGVLQPWGQYPAAAGTYTAGQMVNAADGKINPVTGASTETPGYLCMADVTLAEGGMLPVARVVKDEIYITQLSAETAGAVVGAKLQVSAGGLQVNGGAAGTFEVVQIEGTAAGSEVHGRFV